MNCRSPGKWPGECDHLLRVDAPSRPARTAFHSTSPIVRVIAGSASGQIATAPLPGPSDRSGLGEADLRWVRRAHAQSSGAATFLMVAPCRVPRPRGHVALAARALVLRIRPAKLPALSVAASGPWETEWSEPYSQVLG